jgi:hypothetical protein
MLAASSHAPHAATSRPQPIRRLRGKDSVELLILRLCGVLNDDLFKALVFIFARDREEQL